MKTVSGTIYLLFFYIYSQIKRYGAVMNESIEKQALELDLASRAKLAKKLLQSMEDLSETELERLWAEEAVRRDEEITQGKARTIPADEVFKNAYLRFGRND